MKTNPILRAGVYLSASEWNSMIKSLGGANVAGGNLNLNNHEY